jgi:hypothetical protein
MKSLTVMGEFSDFPVTQALARRGGAGDETVGLSAGGAVQPCGGAAVQPERWGYAS